ncbi:MAG: hypothetical protein ABR898_17430 [Terracidiphilus sp.]|jgi:hypothetical protein
MRLSIPLNSKCNGVRLLSLLALAAALGGSQMLAAQAPAATSTTAPAHKPLHTHTRPSAAHPLTPPAAAALPAATPAVLEAPHWPANDRPVEASVVWDSQGLSIDAQNSSLEQILRDFSTATGAKVEGLASDERVFGFYGPGQARDVLSQLLQGSGYNVIMIGDQGQGAPRQIVLSVRQAGAAQPAANHPASSDDDADADEPAPVPQLPQPIPPPFRPGFPGRAPQQLNPQEQQLREQQIREQQMQQPANPPN